MGMLKCVRGLYGISDLPMADQCTAACLLTPCQVELTRAGHFLVTTSTIVSAHLQQDLVDPTRYRCTLDQPTGRRMTWLPLSVCYVNHCQQWPV